MIEELRELQRQFGAVLSPETHVPVTFGNDTEGLKSAYTRVSFYDCSHWGLLRLTGEDRARFLHNQSTNNINLLAPGQGCETVFVTSTGRTLDLATVYITHDAIDLLVSPNRRQNLVQWMDRYIFPMDKVGLADLSDQYSIFTLIGPNSNLILQKLGLDSIIGQPQGHNLIAELGESLVRIGVGSGLTLPGYTLIVPRQEALSVWQSIINTDVTLIGDRVWEKLRILEGRPAADHELTEDYNPLEAGLWKDISFNKGCYIGQETIARLNTYKGVKQRLWGIQLPQPVAVGTEIFLEGEKVGLLTSCTETDQGAFGLGYIKTKAGGVGLQVTLGGQKGEVVTVPFLTHEFDIHPHPSRVGIPQN